jgi:hypothetical protein
MPRTHKTLSRQDLYKIPVYIQDTGVESTFFNIKQLNPVFTGGRNAFLISGTPYLKPNTQILIEVLDINGNSIYVEAIKNFVEAGARLVVIEVYENTPVGVGMITIVGTAAYDSTLAAVPTDWDNRINVRWQRRIIVEPRNRNSTPIRLKKRPEIIVTELLQSASILTATTISSSIQNFTLTPQYKLSKQSGYAITNNPQGTAYASYHLTPRLTGSIAVQKILYTIDTSIPSTTQTTLENHTALVNLPLTLLNQSQSFTDTNIISNTDSSTLNINRLSYGNYVLTESINIIAPNTTAMTVSIISSSVLYSYISESYTPDVGIETSYANLRIINLDTISGEIFRIKTSNKDAASQNEFSFVADTPTYVGEILATSSIYFKEIPLGKFNTQSIIDTYWYANYTTSSVTPGPSYISSSLLPSLQIQRDNSKILDAAYVITTGSNYYLGTKNNFTFFPTSEYTLTFDSYVYNQSSSIQQAYPSYSADVYLVGSAAVTDNPYGLFIGTVNATQVPSYFSKTAFNFKTLVTGSAGLRFVVKSGFWQFANISLTVVQENGFSPDEVVLNIPNSTYLNKNLVFKTELFDLNNNVFNLDIVSVPAYFTGTTPPWSVKASIDTHKFVGNGSTSNYTLSSSVYNAESLFVSVDGLTMTNTIDYTLSGTTLAFIFTPPSQSNILVKAFTI